MDDVRVGRLLRALRLRRGLRQVDVAVAAEVGQSTISLVERGHLDRLALRTVRTIFAVVDARFDGVVSWRGGATDRLIDERHSLVVGEIAAILRAEQWTVELEVTYAIFGERGSIDLLAFHSETGTLLVIEVKTEITSVEETIRRHDAKTRLAASIAKTRFGWRSRSGANRLLVVLDTSANRRRIARHERTLRVAYPSGGREVRRWLRRPAVSFAGLLFLSVSNPHGARNARQSN